MWSGSDVEKNAWLHIADMVTQKYPDIKIKFETAPFNDFWTKLTTQAASGNAPCVIGLQGQRAPQFGNLLIPLDDYMSKAGIKASDYVPSITKGLQFEGKQVALPYDVGPFVVFYNKDAFKAAGLKEPAIGWTTDEFFADAKALTKPPKYGFWAQSDIGALLPWVLSSSGKSALNAEGKLDVDNPEWHAVRAVVHRPGQQGQGVRADTQRELLVLGRQPVPGRQRVHVARRSLEPDQRPGAGEVRGRDRPDAGRRQRLQDLVRRIRLRRHQATARTPTRRSRRSASWSERRPRTTSATSGAPIPALISTQNSWYEGNNTQDVKPVMDYSLTNSIPYTTIPTWQQVVTTFSKQAVATYNGQGSVDDLLSQTQAQGGS